jgi:hypothetical protein
MSFTVAPQISPEDENTVSRRWFIVENEPENEQNLIAA